MAQPTRHDKPVRQYHHGRSPAAWTGVTIAGLGFIVATVAALTGPNWTLAWIAAAMIVVSLLASGILKAAGFGNG